MLLDALLTDLPARQVAPHPGTAAAVPHRPRRHHGRRPGRTGPHTPPGNLRPVVHPRPRDRRRALSATGIADLAERSIDELSGGQRQRVWIAMALAQDTDILLLDEPTTFLDLPHQLEILDLLRDLNTARGTTIVMVLHDLNLAARYCDRLIALRDGRVAVAGTPDQVVTPAIIREVFDLESHVMPDPAPGPRWSCPLAATGSSTAPS
ncbi:ABC transporter ATP-binding protein [Corynebacterium suedekumii]|nr:ABC transporter ATP-binding protein [Corynebacterium suedekumii]